MGIALRLARQFHDNGLVTYFLKIVQEKHGFVKCRRLTTEVLLIRRKTQNKQIFTTIVSDYAHPGAIRTAVSERIFVGLNTSQKSPCKKCLVCLEFYAV